MHCDIEIDGTHVSLVRWVGSDRSFYEPFEMKGLRIWFDANTDVFEFLNETHGACKPDKRVRFAIQDATLRICPPRLHPWCPLPVGGLKIADCYDSCDCWLGPYFGADAHGGLDINHDPGTVLFTPISIHEHRWYNHLRSGDNNNRWEGLHHWGEGVSWKLISCHLIELLVPEGLSIDAGVAYATSAGVHNGSHHHTHFTFSIVENGKEYRLDPWILFWQMYRDLETACARRIVRD